MDFESLRKMLQSNDMEEVLAPKSADIFNIFCKKDGEHINTIQTQEDENDNGRRVISPAAHRLLARALNSHNVQHQSDYHLSVYKGEAETVSKTKY